MLRDPGQGGDSSRFAATRPDMEGIAESLWTPVVSRESTMPLGRGGVEVIGRSIRMNMNGHTNAGHDQQC